MAKHSEFQISAEPQVAISFTPSIVVMVIYDGWDYMWTMDFSLFNPGSWSSTSDRAIASSTKHSFVQDWGPDELGIPIWGY